MIVRLPGETPARATETRSQIYLTRPGLLSVISIDGCFRGVIMRT
jgi:hypothetical protein